MAFNASTVTADAFNVTLSDTTVVTAFGFYVGTTGNLQVVTQKGTTVLFTALPAGVIVPLAVSKFQTTNTTASNIVAFGPT